jgi:hypothetical protein
MNRFLRRLDGWFIWLLPFHFRPGAPPPTMARRPQIYGETDYGVVGGLVDPGGMAEAPLEADAKVVADLNRFYGGDGGTGGA